MEVMFLMTNFYLSKKQKNPKKTMGCEVTSTAIED
jgi:hypothetical protein